MPNAGSQKVVYRRDTTSKRRAFPIRLGLQSEIYERYNQEGLGASRLAFGSYEITYFSQDLRIIEPNFEQCSDTKLNLTRLTNFMVIFDHVFVLSWQNFVYIGLRRKNTFE